jgi:hydrogenase expression/formation protein HypD
MRYVDEFRDRDLTGRTAAAIREEARGRQFAFMEVCGTHTMSIFRYGLKEMLPGSIRLISGPGCPVCVTPNLYIDKAIELAKRPEVVLATFGDLLKVPGSRLTLEKERSSGAEIRVVYSTTDALQMAKRLPDRHVVFLGVGFETTAPTVAASILMAEKDRIRNYSVLCGHKTMPEALRALAAGKGAIVDGFMLPGHVSAIIGTSPYGFLAGRYGKRCVVAGFEPADIMSAILALIRQRKPKVEIGYRRAIRASGNRAARAVMNKVFGPVDSEWRGIGVIGNSGLAVRKRFSAFDAERRFDIKTPAPREDRKCICGDILRGIRTPEDCPLYGKKCTPSNPVGACMVSSEGTCAAYYKYADNRFVVRRSSFVVRKKRR